MEFDRNQIMRLAQSPAGKQLIDMLQKNNNPQLQQAAQNASNGDFQSASKQLAFLLDSPQVQHLLKQLEDIK